MRSPRDNEYEVRIASAELLSVVNTIVEPFGTPQREGVVELEDVDPTARVLVTAAVDLGVAIATVHWNQLVRRGGIVSDASSFAPTASAPPPSPPPSATLSTAALNITGTTVCKASQMGATAN